jgi:hypothetical protein
MDDKLFKQALNEALTLQYSSMLDIDMSHLTHEFSRAYIKSRDRLIKLRSRSYYKMISTAGRRVACIIAAFIIATFTTIFSVEALRTAFMDFIMNIFPTHTVFQSANLADAPETIENIYMITYDMSGFEVGFEDYSEHNRITQYVNFDEMLMVSFEQSVKHNWEPHINTEDANKEEINIGGIIVIYFLNNIGYNVYIWETEEYIFHIYGNLPKSVMEIIILSVQKTE